MSANQLSNKDIIQLLPINDLLYTRTAPSNPVVERTQKKSYAEGGSGTTYTALDHMIFNLQTGTDFIDPLQSFAVFEVRVNCDAVAVADLSLAFQGSAMNLVRDSQIETRSGKEMDRLEQANLLAYHQVMGDDPEFASHNLSGLMMANTKNVLADISTRNKFTIAIGVQNSTWHKIMIPLKYVSPIFDSEKLMPPHLARGLKIDCTLEAFKTAFTEFTATNEADSYTIRKPYILTDNYRMADSVLEFLNADFASKKSGLVYEYFSYHTTKTTTADTNLDVEVRRSVSMAVDLFACTRLAANKSLLTHDSFASYPISDSDRIQFRIGSHYLPNAPSEGIVELYAQYLYYANLLRDNKVSGLTYSEFLGALGISAGTSVNHGDGKFCTTLQRNAILDLSGIAINNSMTLAIEGTLGVAASRNVSLFLRHLRRAVLFLESSQLET